MPLLSPEIAPDVALQCTAAAVEIAQAFARAFGGQFAVSIGEPEALAMDEVAAEWEMPGLAVVLQVGTVGLAVVIPDSAGLLPDGYDSADPLAQSKLTTLAQELGILMLPESLLADDAQAFRVANLAVALREGQITHRGALLRLVLKSAAKRAEALVVWPLAAPGNTIAARTAAATRTSGRSTEADTVAAEGAAGAIPRAAAALQDAPSGGVAATLPTGQWSAAETPAAARIPAGQKPSARGPGLRDLPPYTRSLLKIRVPLSVTLAAKKQPLGQVLEIGPGSILQFEKSCEEMLDLNVSNLPIARGEAVKVGDKFGLRVTSLIMPSERFKTVMPPQTARATPGS